MAFDYCVLVGRFQPLHNEHVKLIKKSLTESKKLIILLGSHKAAPNLRNPWSYDERIKMFNMTIEGDIRDAIHFAPIRDYLYNDSTWIAQVQKTVRQIIQNDPTREKEASSVCLGGNFKDATSYYLNLFPQWKKVGSFINKNLDATTIRNLYFSEQDGWQDMVPCGTLDFLIKQQESDWYKNLCAEYDYIQKYKKSWESAPFPPTFVTVDVVVQMAGHVLVVKRKMNPGKGLYALPGGFINQNETIKDAAIRELYEETGIRVPKSEMRNCIVDVAVFDHPLRSLRGRTLTHAHHIKLEGKDLPAVHGGDDAEDAMWMSLSDIYEHESEFFEDHIHLINYFIQKS